MFCRIQSNDSSEEKLQATPVLCTQDTHYELSTINDQLKLALSLLIVVRSKSIAALSEKQTDIMKLCRHSYVSSASTSLQQERTSLTTASSTIATAFTLRASLVISQTIGGSVAMSTRDKLISRAKLKKVGAIIDIDRQLIDQLNILLYKLHSLKSSYQLSSHLELPLDVNEIVSHCIRLYKRSAHEANQWYTTQLDTLQAEKEKIQHMITILQNPQI